MAVIVIESRGDKKDLAIANSVIIRVVSLDTILRSQSIMILILEFIDPFWQFISERLKPALQFHLQKFTSRLFMDCLVTETDFVVFANPDHLQIHPFANCEIFLDIADIPVTYLGNVNQSVDSFVDLDKSTIGFDSRDPSFDNVSDLHTLHPSRFLIAVYHRIAFLA
jgi:hypothetical protein